MIGTPNDEPRGGSTQFPFEALAKKGTLWLF